MPHWAGESVGGVKKVQPAAEIVHGKDCRQSDTVRQEHGDTPLYLIVLAQKPAQVGEQAIAG